MLYTNTLLSLVAMTIVYHVTAEHSFLGGILKRKSKSLSAYSAAKRQQDVEQGNQHEEMCFTIPHLRALKEQFASYIDANGDEKASKEEITAYLRKYNPAITEAQVLRFMAKRDKDGDGSVDFIPDYLLEVSSANYDLNTAREWFELEDTNGDGYVSRDELITIAVNVGMSPEEAEQTAVGYYMSADQDGDGRLSWKEYLPLYLPSE